MVLFRVCLFTRKNIAEWKKFKSFIKEIYAATQSGHASIHLNPFNGERSRVAMAELDQWKQGIFRPVSACLVNYNNDYSSWKLHVLTGCQIWNTASKRDFSTWSRSFHLLEP